MEGQVFGHLTVIERSHRDSNYNWFWKCQCSCGAFRTARGDHIKNGRANSCGCAKRADKLTWPSWKQKKPYNGDLVDKYYRTRNSYKAMIRRCYDPKFLSYRKYGEKGVTVCDRWRTGDGYFSGWRCFLQDMGQRPQGHSLDRIDNTKGYSPENCRWATLLVQANNRTKRR